MGTPDAGEFPADREDDRTYAAALAGLVARDWLTSENHVAQHKRAARASPETGEFAHADLLEFERLLIKRLAKLGVPMFAPEVWRSKERQDELYVLGHSKAKAGQSPHQHGMAVDIVHGQLGWNLSPKQWAVIGHIGKELAAAKGWKIQWGGDWKFYDPAHWEIKDWVYEIAR